MPGLIRHLPHHKPWLVALAAIATVVIVAICSLGSWLVLRDDRKVVSADPTTTATAIPRDIGSRVNDAKPMTAADVFPTTQIVADPTIPPYTRVGAVQVEKNCRVAATAAVGKLLNTLGCNQVVRATFTSPDAAYLVTAGIFNLKDTAAATKAQDELSRLIDRTNRLTGYISAPSTRILGRADTNLAFFADGHFLVYNVIARIDGKASAKDDPHITIIFYDLLEKYLRDGVLVRWSLNHLGPSASTSPQPSAS